MRRRAASSMARVCLLAVLGFLAFFPFLFMVSTSMKSIPEFYRNYWLPSMHPHWVNYAEAWREVRGYLGNSIVVSSVSVAGVLVFSSLAAFALGRMRFRGRQALYYAIIAVLMIPPILTLVPTFMVVRGMDISLPVGEWAGRVPGLGRLVAEGPPAVPRWAAAFSSLSSWYAGAGWHLHFRLLDTLWALILPYIAGGQAFSVFILTTFFRTMPGDLFDSAAIDGASRLRQYRYLALPLAKPVLGTVAMITALGTWNNFIWPLVTISTPGRSVITTGLLMFGSEYGGRYGAMAAGQVIASLPLVVMFLLATRVFLRGMTAGAFKM